MRMIRRGITGICVGMILLLLLFQILPLAGYEIYYVSSGSMEPALHTGDIIFVKRCELEDLRVSDIVTYILNQKDTLVTHRVIWMDKENGILQTKGDANEEKDSNYIHEKAVIGKVIFHLPLLGNLVWLISSWSGKLFVLGVFLWLQALRMFLEQWLEPPRRRRIQHGKT